MSLQDMVNRLLNASHQGENGEESNVSSLLDLIFPKGAKRAGIFGIDDIGGIIHFAQELPGILLSFFQTRAAKLQKFIHDIFEAIKAKANEMHQMLVSMNSSTGITPPPITPPAIGRPMEPSGFVDPSHGLARDMGGHGGAGHGM